MGRDTELFKAAKVGNTAYLQKIFAAYLKRKTDVSSISNLRKTANPNMQDEYGYTLLHHATLNGQKEAVELLLRCGASTYIPDMSGSFPLHMAAWKGNITLVQMLVQQGPSVADVNQQSDSDDTALHLAATYGYTDVVEYLLQRHANALLRNVKGETPLDLAAQYGHLDSVHLIVSHSPEVLRGYTPLAETSPLHLAARNGHTLVVLALINAGLSVDTVCKCGSALHESALCGKTETVELLLEKGIDTTLQNSSGKDALEVLSGFTAEKSIKIQQMIQEARNRTDRLVKDGGGRKQSVEGGAAGSEKIIAVATKNYSPVVEHSNALAFKKGDYIVVERKDMEGVFVGSVHGRSGSFLVQDADFFRVKGENLVKTSASELSVTLEADSLTSPEKELQALKRKVAETEEEKRKKEEEKERKEKEREGKTEQHQEPKKTLEQIMYDEVSKDPMRLSFDLHSAYCTVGRSESVSESGSEDAGSSSVAPCFALKPNADSLLSPRRGEKRMSKKEKRFALEKDDGRYMMLSAVDPKDAESDFGEGLRLNPIGPAFAGAGVGAGDGSGTPPISPNMGTAVVSSVVGDGSGVVSPPSPSHVAGKDGSATPSSGVLVGGPVTSSTSTSSPSHTQHTSHPSPSSPLLPPSSSSPPPPPRRHGDDNDSSPVAPKEFLGSYYVLEVGNFKDSGSTNEEGTDKTKKPDTERSKDEPVAGSDSDSNVSSGQVYLLDVRKDSNPVSSDHEAVPSVQSLDSKQRAAAYENMPLDNKNDSKSVLMSLSSVGRVRRDFEHRTSSESSIETSATSTVAASPAYGTSDKDDRTAAAAVGVVRSSRERSVSEPGLLGDLPSCSPSSPSSLVSPGSGNKEIKAGGERERGGGPQDPSSSSSERRNNNLPARQRSERRRQRREDVYLPVSLKKNAGGDSKPGGQLQQTASTATTTSTTASKDAAASASSTSRSALTGAFGGKGGNGRDVLSSPQGGFAGLVMSASSQLEDSIQTAGQTMIEEEGGEGGEGEGGGGGGGERLTVNSNPVMRNRLETMWDEEKLSAEWSSIDTLLTDVRGHIDTSIEPTSPTKTSSVTITLTPHTNASSPSHPSSSSPSSSSSSATLVTPSGGGEGREARRGDVGNWLQSLKMGGYGGAMETSGFDDLRFLNGVLSEDDLEDLGVTSQEDKLTILAAATLLPIPPSVGHASSVREFLDALRLSDLGSKFSGYSLERLSRLMDIELSSVLGVEELGYRRRLCLGIRQLRDNHPEWWHRKTSAGLPPKSQQQQLPVHQVTSLLKECRHMRRSHSKSPSPSPSHSPRTSPRASNSSSPSPRASRSRGSPNRSPIHQDASNYKTKYLGSVIIHNVKGTQSTEEACLRLRASIESVKRLPSIFLSISWKGVKFVDYETMDVVSTHAIRDISYCTQDIEDGRVFAYITKDRLGLNYCHVFMASTKDIAEKVVKTIGQAFEVAYHKVMKARNSKQPGKKTSPTETVIAKTATVAASATCSSAS